MAFTGETYQEALYDFQKAFTQRVNTILKHMGFDGLPPQSAIKQQKRDQWGDGYFHVNFQALTPIEVRYEPQHTVTLERKPGEAAERVYTNKTSVDQNHVYEHQRDHVTRKLRGTTNMQGLEISNKLTVGTGEGASVKVENETTVTVSASFEQSTESEKTDSTSEKDTTSITVVPNTKVRVTQARWDSKMEQTDKVFLQCDVAFEIHAHRKRVPDGVYPNEDYKKTGSDARRVIVAKSLSDFRSILRGINSRYPKLRKDFLKNGVIADNLNWITKNASFVKIEESTFENASYGEVVEEETAV